MAACQRNLWGSIKFCAYENLWRSMKVRYRQIYTKKCDLWNLCNSMKIDEINEASQAAWFEQSLLLGQPVPLVGWLHPSSSKIHAPDYWKCMKTFLETAGIHRNLYQSMELTENIWKTWSLERSLKFFWNSMNSMRIYKRNENISNYLQCFESSELREVQLKSLNPHRSRCNFMKIDEIF